jgi:hypothetical protein
MKLPVIIDPRYHDAVIFDAEAGVAAGRNGGFGFVIGIDRTGHRDALVEQGADGSAARSHGIRWFIADVLAENTDMLRVLCGTGWLRQQPNWPLLVSCVRHARSRPSASAHRVDATRPARSTRRWE